MDISAESSGINTKRARTWMLNDGHYERKRILVMRYKLDSPSIFLHYTTFCNAIQMPAWVNIMGQYSSIEEDQSPTVYDYFGIEIKKLSVQTNRAAGRQNFHQPFGTHHDNIDEGLAIFLQTKPNYFVIESKMFFIDEKIDGDGRAILDERSQKLFVPVIFKDNFYYICPGEETSSIYRIHHPTDIFFTSKGHDVLRALIGRVFMLKHWCYVREINIVLPKESKPVTNWDKKSDFDISVCVPYPVVSTNTVPASSWCSVQPIRLDDGKYIKDVVINYSSESDADISLDELDENEE